MKIVLQIAFIVAGLTGCSGAHADAGITTLRSSRLPVHTCVEVREVKGTVGYAYDSTGWRPLTPGKLLRAGATIRAESGSSAILKVDGRCGLVRVSPATSVHITAQTPAEELIRPVLAAAPVDFASRGK